MQKHSFKYLLSLTITALLFVSCTDRTGAEKTIRHYGFKPIEVGGFSFFSGSNGDFYCTKFKAVTLDGDTVEGVITKGLIFKGSTVRLKD